MLVLHYEILHKSKDYLKINVDQVRKSYDLRDVDSVFSYVAYSNQNKKQNRLRVKDIDRKDLNTNQLVKAIKWNDTRVNGLQTLFHGKLNLLRNSITHGACYSNY